VTTTILERKQKVPGSGNENEYERFSEGLKIQREIKILSMPCMNLNKKFQLINHPLHSFLLFLGLTYKNKFAILYTYQPYSYIDRTGFKITVVSSFLAAVVLERLV